jgi:hypothetical protein
LVLNFCISVYGKWSFLVGYSRRGTKYFARSKISSHT